MEKAIAIRDDDVEDSKAEEEVKIEDSKAEDEDETMFPRRRGRLISNITQEACLKV
ncbi:unnamed protein product [Arabis nemorensis]|uniref:Uncharacterized protein n=1 Tax=Arabis nemorensis TaxID=586526 RepID=A0A565C7D7_9BRAS|nr:unnamed protein product [Arabis nemorensis]